MPSTLRRWFSRLQVRVALIRLLALLLVALSKGMLLRSAEEAMLRQRADQAPVVG